MGVKIIRITPGDGQNFPEPGDEVTVHYVGTLADGGAKFDSSRDRGKPFKTRIGVGEVIRGWDEGITQLSLGEIATLVVDSGWAYGDDGYPPKIPPGATLEFNVELLEIKRRR